MLALIRWLGSALVGMLILIAGYFWYRLNKADSRLAVLESRATETLTEERLREVLAEVMRPAVNKICEVIDHVNLLFDHVQRDGMQAVLRVPIRPLEMPGHE